MQCLNCRHEMAEKLQQTRRGPVYYDLCEACGSIWFDAGEMDAMVLPLYRSVEASSLERPNGVSEPLRNCPRCDNHWMRKVYFLALSDILLDHCDGCRGFWLDGGEFERINRELAELKSHGGGDYTPSPFGELLWVILNPLNFFPGP